MDAVFSNILRSVAAHPFDMEPVADMMAYLSEFDRDPDCTHEARRVISSYIDSGNLKADQLERCADWLRTALTIDAPYELDAFMQAMEFDREPESRLWLPRRKHLWRMCRELEWLEFHDGECLLTISMPPRTGKSSIAGMFMVWHFGRHPQTANLMTGYADKLTRHFYTQELIYITDPEYRYEEIFPDAPLVWQSAEDEAFSVGKHLSYPTCTCRTIGGTLTGAVEVGEGGILYSDDLIKDNEEATSPTRLESKWDAYVNQAYDRRKKGAKQLMIGTRWAVKDPIGRMLELNDGSDSCHELTIPALDPVTGESNFDYLYGKGYDRQYFIDMQMTTDSFTYKAKYDGRPEVREGQLFAPDSLRRYMSLPAGEPQKVYATVDTKGKGADYCAMPVLAWWESDPSSYYMIDCICDNSIPSIVDRRVAAAIVKNGVQLAQFESNREGDRIAEDIRNVLDDGGYLCAITKKFSSSNKETRILAASEWICTHVVFRDRQMYSQGDYERFMNQLTGFTLDSKNPHDDAPDALSMFALMVASEIRRKAEPMKRPF